MILPGDGCIQLHSPNEAGVGRFLTEEPPASSGPFTNHTSIGELEMRATVQNYIRAERERREENGEKGFSLIELIVVVVILGILAAIAIPVFMNIQDTAAQNAVDTTAANGATTVATAIANSQDPTTQLAKMKPSNATLSVAPATGATLENYCVTAKGSGKTSTEGPGC